MYSVEEKKKALDLYIKYDMQLTKTIRTLGYPSRNALRKWYYQYTNGVEFKEIATRVSKYTDIQKEVAVSYYIEHGTNISKTIAELGYPCRSVLKSWIIEKHPESLKHCSYRKSLVEYSKEQKELIVNDLLLREKSAKKIAVDAGIDRVTLYNWKNQQLGKEMLPKMDQRVNLPNDKKSLEDEVKHLQEQIHKLTLEKKVLEKTSEMIKKDKGVNPENLSNKEKTLVIDALKNQYKLNELLYCLNISKSSYYYQKNRMKKVDKYTHLKREITTIFNENYNSYGYRRIYLSLRNKGVIVSEKVILRLMKECGLVVYQAKQRKYSSYLGEISPEVDNVIERDFYSEKPNSKWLTDITEFHIPAGKIYLSPIIDCFDGIVVSWTIGTSPNADLVNTMLDNAIAELDGTAYPIIHSDRGAHYRWPGWIERMNNAKLVRSMSKKGCSPDNSACEGFFGGLKNEMFHGKQWLNISIDEFIKGLDKYIEWYNKKRIKKSLNGLSPFEYRRKLGYIA